MSPNKNERADYKNRRWYRDEAMRISQIALTKFGAEMDEIERRDLADAIYRAVRNSIER